MGEDNDHSDMIPYVILFVILLVLINTVFKWWIGSWADAVDKATGLDIFK